jgi:hypothetical protein
MGPFRGTLAWNAAAPCAGAGIQPMVAAMRVRSDIWVKAYLRGRFGAGVMGAVVHSGDPDAGAIYIKVNRLDGTVAVYGPAPQSLDAEDQERRFVLHHKQPLLPEAEADAYLERQRSFDSDLWIVEIEDRGGHAALENWLAQPSR